MRKKAFRIFRHAIVMVRRTLQSYMLLSVTIVLSFSLLLGYLVYTDSATYNKYKEIFSKDRSVLSLYDANMENDKVEIILRQVADMKNTYQYIQYETSAYILGEQEGILENGKKLAAVNAFINCIPNRVWGIYDLYGIEKEITYLDGKKHEGIVLNSGEAFMDEITFRLLGLDKMEEPVYYLTLRNNDGQFFSEEDVIVQIPIKIVGTFPTTENKEKIIVEEREDGVMSLQYDVMLYLSLDDFNMSDYPEFYWKRRLYFYSETPELVAQAVDRFSYTTVVTDSIIAKDFVAVGVYSQQDEALEQMKIEARTKAIIAAALLLLLGINLYSSFTNALNDRKFEIGVKRAIGAMSSEIIRQFLYESIVVMLANIVVSIALVTDIFIIYKFIYESIPNEWGYYNEWIIYISPYSIAMFAICSITLTVVFSLIFAYKSTQVEIVQYLKAE